MDFLELFDSARVPFYDGVLSNLENIFTISIDALRNRMYGGRTSRLPASAK